MNDTQLQDDPVTQTVEEAAWNYASAQDIPDAIEDHIVEAYRVGYYDGRASNAAKPF